MICHLKRLLLWIFVGNRPTTHFHDVQQFHHKFGLLASDEPVHLTKRKLGERVECLQEELNEFKDAIETQDLAKQGDALIDLVYFALGTAVMLGLPWDKMWNEVQRANMAKEPGTTHRGHAVDVRKPAGWIGPQHELILEAHGYDRDDWGDEGEIWEEVCRDDQDRGEA